MAVATGDLLQITDFQQYLGEECLNVYYYRYFSAPTIDNTVYEPLIDDFASRVIGAVRQIQVNTLKHDRLQIKNLSNGIDFFEKVINIDGELDVADDAELQSYVSLGFQLIRDSLVTRNGYKRIAGLVESQVDGNTVTRNGYKRIAGLVESQVDGNTFTGGIGTVNGIRDRFTESLTVGIIQVAAPVIVKRPIPVPAGSAYVYSSVVECLFKGLGTQNTRKP